MPDVFSTLAAIAAARPADPLAPVTVIAPSHAAALQLRRRLAGIAPFAGVRFETLPRIAELLGAGYLAAQGRSPLARPIGDYVAEQVARESRGALEQVADLPGYARVLRQIFRRLRRGGILRAAGVRAPPSGGHFSEILRLYDRYRADTAAFYDESDLMDEAAVAVDSGRSGALGDLGAIYVVPPRTESAAGDALLRALAAHAPGYQELDEAMGQPEARFVLAPDPASEARETAREVVAALESGVALTEVAVLHGADHAYPRLLREAMAAAAVPAVPLPGIPLIETPAGRGVLSLALLPGRDFARTAMMDMLSVAPIKEWLPGRADQVRRLTTDWDRLSREAGVTRGAGVWTQRLQALIRDREAALAGPRRDENEARARAWERERAEAARLLGFIETLIGRLTPLREPRAATSFIKDFTKIVEDYFEPGAEALDEVLEEIRQLGTVGAVGGSFSLSSFAQALGANLEAAYRRPNSLGNGVLIADYRAAAGLRFRHVVLCGAYEGVLPAGPGAEPLVEDRVWARLRQEHPWIEDAARRIERGEEAVGRAVAAAGDGTATWGAPLYEPGGTREYYPSPAMVEAISRCEGRRITASELRRRDGDGVRLRRGSSPLAAVLRGRALDAGELLVRQAVLDRQHGRAIGPGHDRWRAVSMLRSRRGAAFTEWDGNLASLAASGGVVLPRTVSPTSLEQYAACGFRYFGRSLLRLNAVEEPDEREMMDAATRGQLIHRILDDFFKAQKDRGRPGVGEPWDAVDLEQLIAMTRDRLAEAKERGLTGLDVYADHEQRMILMDLARFLEDDAEFRLETGAVPSEFEQDIPEVEIAGVKLRGRVDRIDRSPDGTRAWVIDYKTGSARDFEKMADDPLLGGQKLQLPVYLAAAGEAKEPVALYWFITHKGGFQKFRYERTPQSNERFERTLQAILAGIGSGSFPAVSDEEDEYYGKHANCRYCDFDRICSRRREYEFDAKQGDPAFAPWVAVGAAARKKEGAG